MEKQFNLSVWASRPAGHFETIARLQLIRKLCAGRTFAARHRESERLAPIEAEEEEEAVWATGEEFALVLGKLKALDAVWSFGERKKKPLAARD